MLLQAPTKETHTDAQPNNMGEFEYVMHSRLCKPSRQFCVSAAELLLSLTTLRGQMTHKTPHNPNITQTA
jgi:hypothetical protein